jgi:hypothetical protein
MYEYTMPIFPHYRKLKWNHSNGLAGGGEGAGEEKGKGVGERGEKGVGELGN